MKRYWLFYGDSYYPIGGMHDFHGSYDTSHEARYHLKNNDVNYDWAHIYDSIDCNLIEVYDDE